MTPAEALKGATVIAARAVGLEERSRLARARQGRRLRGVRCARREPVALPSAAECLQADRPGRPCPSLRPTEVSTPAPAPDDPRVGHLLGRGLGTDDGAKVILVGFPSDEVSVATVDVRARLRVPSAIRSVLYRLTPDARDERFIRLLELHPATSACRRPDRPAGGRHRMAHLEGCRIPALDAGSCVNAQSLPV